MFRLITNWLRVRRAARRCERNHQALVAELRAQAERRAEAERVDDWLRLRRILQGMRY